MFYDRLFFVPKPDGSFCPIIDLKVLNQYLELLSFKTEILYSIAAMLPPREWMIKIDLKNAYPHIIVPPNIHKYFRLVVNSVTNQFRTLPFGLFTAPREFIKTLAPVEQLLRSWGIQIQAYLDWMFRASSTLQDQPYAQITLQLSKTLGWTVNWDKCLLVASQQVDFLGLHFDLIQAVVTPPECHTSMSDSYSRTIPVCQTYFMNNQLNLSLCFIYSSGTTSSFLSAVLAKFS